MSTSSKNMRIILIGQAAFGKDVFEALYKNNENIVGVFCPPSTSNNKQDPLKISADQKQVPVFQFSKMRSKEAILQFKNLAPDLCIMAFVTDIIPSEILEFPSIGTIQYHPSLLPKHRGPSSMNWPIIQGETETGVTIFWPDENLDTGPILLQKKVAIETIDTLGSLYFTKLYPMGIDAFLEAVTLIKSGKIYRSKQDDSNATYESWCKPKDVIINWNHNTNSIYNLVRGSDPSPGANTNFKNNKLYLYGATISKQATLYNPGEIIGINSHSITIATRDGAIEFAKARLNSGSKLSANEIINTANILTGDILGTN